MAYSTISSIRVTVLLIWISLSYSTESTASVKLPDIAVVSNIIDYIRPFIQSLRLAPTKTHERTSNHTSVESAIDAKIAELKPVFQDRDSIGISETDANNNFELEGDEETTIIEFFPKTNELPKERADADKSFQANLKKYERMRNKIKLALEKESVSHKTKKMVTKTLDELIAKLVGSQCPNKMLRGSDIGFCNGNQCNNMSVSDILHKLFQPEVNSEKIVDVFTKFFGDTGKNMMNNFTHTVSNVVRDLQKVPNNYKVRCTMVDLNKERLKSVDVGDGNCDDFKICSEELREYISDFYKSLNDTTISVFRNYAAMYSKDILADENEEKSSVITTINNVSNIVEDRLKNIFIKQVSKVTLDEQKNKEANIEAIKDYVRKTVRRVLRSVDKHLEPDLSSFRARLLLPIKKDIMINLDVELGNLESNYRARVCSFFVTCNGEVTGSFRKRSSDKIPTNKMKRNSVYVKVQLKLDDELKKTIAEKRSKVLRNGTTFIDLGPQYVNYINNTDVKVTRTTNTNADLNSVEGYSTKAIFRAKSSSEYDEEVEGNTITE